jgi:hypothetical protein
MQSLNIFGARQSFLFEFKSLGGVWKFENHLTSQARMSAAHFHLTAWDGRPVLCAAPVPDGVAHHVESSQHRWQPVLAAPRGLAPHTTTPDVIEEVVAHSTFSPPPFGCAPSCSAPCSSCTKSLSAAPASEAEPRDFPAVVFLREHLAGGSLLRFVAHPIDPAACSVPSRSSSPTSSSTTSTTPSAPQWCLLPVGTHAAAESPPLVSTPFLASPPRFSCSGM